ncbi:hypothetical protein KP509_15G025100 [Ceratopteris richardii]|uniref:RING-type E3 ubiquitin transferase n=1 Tax=Ceratopteris richardii TaxID=49495 RepID=A0A8T2T7U3_CERRI|nr:hypothetical protein KP509_15G025100 [Ceratopteris richardii]
MDMDDTRFHAGENGQSMRNIKDEADENQQSSHAGLDTDTHGRRTSDIYAEARRIAICVGKERNNGLGALKWAIDKKFIAAEGYIRLLHVMRPVRFIRNRNNVRDLLFGERIGSSGARDSDIQLDDYRHITGEIVSIIFSEVAGDQRQRGAVLSEANSTSSSNASSYQNELEELRAAENISRQKLEEEISMHTETKKELDNERRLRKIAEEKCASGESEAAFSGWRRVHNFWWKYSYEEIEGATENFNKMNKLGQGIYGQIYKGTLHHISVAVKVLAEEGIGDREEFHRKLELLSRLHHPHLVMLIGSCPDKACIIYEYMANGSLEERLYCKGGTPPLPWFTRFRICLEVARALLFLHSRPQPIAHRDLKLRNVLLDRGFVSKITDICVSDLVPMNNAAYTTIVREIMFTATLPYMDPHYLRTGIVSCEADVYALGILILQLLTKKPPLGIACVVEEALEHEQFYEMLDQSAGEWPLEEAMVVARLGLRCMEPKPKDRPKLEAGVLPVLESVQKPPGL